MGGPEHGLCSWCKGSGRAAADDVLAQPAPAMTSHMKLDEKALREILDGCEGVTPGPWGWSIIDASMASLGVLPDPGSGDPHVLSVSPCESCRGDEWEWGKCLTPNKPDADHIARLDPQTVASIVTELLELRASHAPKGGVGVEPLEWRPENYWPGLDGFEAIGVGVSYAITGKDVTGWTLISRSPAWSRTFDDLAAAKAAAQADYEARILSALTGSDTQWQT